MSFLLVNHDGLMQQILGWLSLIFFGGDGIFVAIKSLKKRTRTKSTVSGRTIESIIVTDNGKLDDAELIQFYQDCRLSDAEFQEKAKAIMVKRVDEPDKEVLEEWSRVCEFPDEEQELHLVHVTRWDDPRFPWAITFGLADWVRQPPNDIIVGSYLTQALLNVPGVKQAVREDRERWLVEGDTTGDTLIRAASVAVDTFLARYRDKLG